MGLAIFDLDNTLIDGDSDHAWNEFLVARQCVDDARYRSENDRFHRDYQRGELDIAAYLDFALEPLARLPRNQLDALHRQFMQEVIDKIWLPQAEALIHRHRSLSHHIMIITATNRFVVEPIAKRLGVDSLLASELEEIDGCFTGRPRGEPCYREGKPIRLQQWLEQNPQHQGKAQWFYSDSINDMPLLQAVEHPVVVDPDQYLRLEAEKRNWPIISLRCEAAE